MADVEDQSSLETWLRDQQPNFVCVLATRVAFRVAPLLVEALHDDKAKRCASIVLPSFRMLAVASAGTVWPERASEISKSFQSSINEASNAIGEEYNAAQLGVIECKEIFEPCLDLEVDG